MTGRIAALDALAVVMIAAAIATAILAAVVWLIQCARGGAPRRKDPP